MELRDREHEFNTNTMFPVSLFNISVSSAFLSDFAFNQVALMNFAVFS